MHSLYVLKVQDATYNLSGYLYNNADVMVRVRYLLRGRSATQIMSYHSFMTKRIYTNISMYLTRGGTFSMVYSFYV